MSELFSNNLLNYLKQNGVDINEIQTLDLSGWNTSNVSDMHMMFNDYSGL